jgi:excisionase family DNA binding protein
MRDRHARSSCLAGMNPSSPAGPDPIAFSREDLLTAEEVAEILRLKRATALDYMRRGVIPAFKLGRKWYSVRPRLDEHLASLSGGGTIA